MNEFLCPKCNKPLKLKKSDEMFKDKLYCKKCRISDDLIIEYWQKRALSAEKKLKELRKKM